MMQWRRPIRWLAGLMALAVVVLPLFPSEAHSLSAVSGIPCLHHGEAPKTPPLLSPDTMPCDGHHCTHSSCCCLSGCLAFAGLALPAEAPLLARFPQLAIYPPHPSTRANRLGARPAVPPPRAIV